MTKLTYKQAYDKIIEAYFKNEMRPADPCFCFCGTLCNNSHSWFKAPLKQHNDFAGYKGVDFVKMETALFSGICDEFGRLLTDDDKCAEYENNLFTGMCAALEVLKQIHKERGENVEDFQFTKRQLV